VNLELSLTLLVFLIRADHPHHPAAADDLALVANSLDRSSYLHCILIPGSGADLPRTRHNPPTSSVHGRQFQLHPIPDQHPDEIAIRSIGDVRRHLPAIVEPHPVERLRQLFDDDPG
jgi:hypothetical protein